MSHKKQHQKVKREKELESSLKEYVKIGVSEPDYAKED